MLNVDRSPTFRVSGRRVRPLVSLFISLCPMPSLYSYNSSIRPALATRKFVGDTQVRPQ